MQNLGCGDIGAAIVFRDAPHLVLREISQDIQTAYCSRRLNEVSEAKVTLKDCYDGPEIVPWKHSLLLTWDDQFLWYGPIIDIDDDAEGKGIITAEDLMTWMKHRKVRTDFDSTGAPVDVSTIFATLVNQGFAQDPSVAYTLSSTPTGITAERRVLATDQKLVFDVISELSTTGIDYTVILQQIICGDVDISTAPVGVLNEANFLGKPNVSLRGSKQGNFVTVSGEGSIVGYAQDGVAQAEYGLLDIVEYEREILDDTSATAAAGTRLDLRATPPIVIGELVLAPTAPLALADIVPGAVVSVSIDGRFVPYAGNVRMESAEFNGVDGRWLVTLNGQPIGTTS